MARKIGNVLMFLPWAGLVGLAIWAASVWDRLPARIAVHFDFQGNPNGWQSPQDLAWGASWMLVAVLMLFTVLGLALRRRMGRGWLVYAIGFDGFCGGLVAVFWGIFLQAVYPARHQMRFMVWIVPALIAAMLAMVIAVMTASTGRWRRPKREPHWTPPVGVVPAGPGQLLAEEVHAGRKWAVVFSLATVFFVVLSGVGSHAFQLAGAIVAGAVVAVLMLACSYMAWDGFHYRFTTSGLEIRALGLRFRWVPLPEIKEYRVETCDPLADFGGWGWRAMPGQRAFIWQGHSGVRIRTWNGDVYLGHEHPERLVQDLDAMMKYGNPHPSPSPCEGSGWGTRRDGAPGRG